MGEGQLRIFNGLPCDYQMQSNITGYENFTLNPFNRFEERNININVSMESFKYNLTTSSGKYILNIQFFKPNEL